jgi:glyoxylate/hydroxypyruvate reductase A
MQALAACLPDARVERWQQDSPAADYAVGWAVPPALFTHQPRLKAFFCAGAGVDDLLASHAVPPALPIVRVEDAGMGEQMADYCSAAVLHWFAQGWRYAQQQARGQWRELPLQQRSDWPVGIFGLGVLGRVVAARLASLGFPVHGCTRSDLASGAQELDRFLQASRVLVLMAPLTPLTRGLFDARRLAQLPRGAFLINVSRGALVPEDALLAALQSGQVAAAALDVFEQEPLGSGHPYWHHPAVRVTPHVAAYTVIEPAARQMALRIRALEAGASAESLPGRVSRQQGY